jgi:hypothetical protein
MRRLSLLLVLAVLFVAVSPSFGAISHYITPIVGDRVSFVDSTLAVQGAVNGPGGGGPFVGQLFDSTGASLTPGLWTTFCVELSESISLTNLNSPTYDVVKVSAADGLFGDTVTASGNIVTEEARWLYYQSLHNPGLLSGYSAGSGADNTALQDAIWHAVQNPINTSIFPSISGDALTWWTAANTVVTGSPLTRPWLNVQVLNPGKYKRIGGVVQTDINGDPIIEAQYQSMLYENSLGEVTPEPASLIVWSVLSAGVAGMALIRRRRGSATRWSAENRQAILEMIENK